MKNSKWDSAATISFYLRLVESKRKKLYFCIYKVEGGMHVFRKYCILIIFGIEGSWETYNSLSHMHVGNQNINVVEEGVNQ